MGWGKQSPPYLRIPSRQGSDTRMNKDIRITHVIRYINAMVSKDKKTLQDSYPFEMSKNQKDYIIQHLEAIKNER